MCQFPFDLDKYIDQAGLETLSGYDYVLLNSKFSYKVSETRGTSMWIWLGIA